METSLNCSVPAVSRLGIRQLHTPRLSLRPTGSAYISNMHCRPCRTLASNQGTELRDSHQPRFVSGMSPLWWDHSFLSIHSVRIALYVGHERNAGIEARRMTRTGKTALAHSSCYQHVSVKDLSVKDLAALDSCPHLHPARLYDTPF